MDTTTPTLRTLLARPALKLRLLPAELPDGALDRALRWVHSSDLADPTPFLADDLVLLTTGTQLERTPVADYVDRLAQRGVIGLGFGSDVHRAGVPEDLAEACAARGIPLFEVPYGTPFIAVARAHAEAIAEQAYSRRTWALEAQRALAIASLRPQGLDAALTELSRRLGCGVTMFDDAGGLVHEHPSGAATAELTAHAAALLARGATASETIEHGESGATLFTLGGTGRLRGVIGVGAAAIDPETRTVVTSVIAMAGLALEQSERLALRERRLDAAVLTLLREGAANAARRVRELPDEPVRIAATETPPNPDWWRRHAPGALVADGLVVLADADAGAADEFAATFDAKLGLSEPGDLGEFSRAEAQATAALRRSGTGVIRYAAPAGILDSLGPDARLAAQSRLAGLREADPGLEEQLRVWLEHDARIEQAAAILGIHRHTLRARIAQASVILQTDLATFPARAELWAALQAAR
ncbi:MULTISPECIES: PucR family transcriptional regulator [unclassified Microbacterium]|uniref:PucR family transcriptional regulator n=1 Tax=unclassified Microbacterium TaxID=2609290 RepID=UPI0012F7A313|nr:PucR family transcriptional regulator [Microbacterium sp. MAH-37]MVQ40842.1 PucR family transcriptional regulator [Microbacterium sp. MAH-37]